MNHLTSVLMVAVSVPSMVSGQVVQKRLGAIDFFGYKGLDVGSIRAALSLREGDPFPGARPINEWKRIIKARVTQVLDRDPTDVRMVCCDDHGNWIIYIGLPGKSSKPVAYNSPPNDDSRLPPNIVKLYGEIQEASRQAVMKGGVGEDHSQGYALLDDPTVREKQLALRENVLQEEATILRVLDSSSDERHRAIAANALGYASKSDRQMSALVKASLDPNDEVRNNAVRALNVLAEQAPETARRIPVGMVIDLLESGSWPDHNKAVFLLATLTRPRDAEVLSQLRLKALDSLVEIARWRSPGHAYPARIIIGRIAGIEENRLSELARTGQVETIINALHRSEQ